MAWALELNALEAMGRFVHLEKHHHRDAADPLTMQDDIGITVPKVDGLGQTDGRGAELFPQFLGRLTPLGSLPKLSDPGSRLR
jgi:hypothetical protein